MIKDKTKIIGVMLSIILAGVLISSALFFGLVELANSVSDVQIVNIENATISMLNTTTALMSCDDVSLYSDGVLLENTRWIDFNTTELGGANDGG